ncbi:MAG TPA: hypothetical protein PK225_10350 [Azonexus sp.]|nr:hypothetical protein [Azonexus sp.]
MTTLVFLSCSRTPIGEHITLIDWRSEVDVVQVSPSIVNAGCLEYDLPIAARGGLYWHTFWPAKIAKSPDYSGLLAFSAEIVVKCHHASGSLN